MTAAEKIAEQWLTEAEVARLEGLTIEALRKRIRAGRDHPPCTNDRGSLRRFPVDEYHRWKKARVIRAIR